MFECYFCYTPFDVNIFVAQHLCAVIDIWLMEISAINYNCFQHALLACCQVVTFLFSGFFLLILYFCDLFFIYIFFNIMLYLHSQSFLTFCSLNFSFITTIINFSYACISVQYLEILYFYKNWSYKIMQKGFGVKKRALPYNGLDVCIFIFWKLRDSVTPVALSPCNLLHKHDLPPSTLVFNYK